MNITRAQIVTQFKRAVRLGWLPFFEAAANGVFDASDLLAIASRETNLDPKWLTKAGDNGNGFGLMQADKRSFPEWIKTGEWKDPAKSIVMGAKILNDKREVILKGVGKRNAVKDSKTGKTYVFTGLGVNEAESRSIAIAAYNSGGWAYYKFSTGKPIDSSTTGKDYSEDVIHRARVFRELYQAHKSTSTVSPLSKNNPINTASAVPKDTITTLPDTSPAELPLTNSISQFSKAKALTVIAFIGGIWSANWYIIVPCGLALIAFAAWYWLTKK